MMSPGELLFLEIQAKQFRTMQMASMSVGERKMGTDRSAWRRVDGMMQYLVYFSYWRKRFKAFFGSYISKHGMMACSRNHPSVDFNGLTFRQPFSELSRFCCFTAPDRAVNFAPKNGVDHP
jgi:hypothetical protein